MVIKLTFKGNFFEEEVLVTYWDLTVKSFLVVTFGVFLPIGWWFWSKAVWSIRVGQSGSFI